MPPKRKAPSPQQTEEVDKKPKRESVKRRYVSGESSKSDASSRSGYDSETSSNDSFYQFAEYYQPEKRIKLKGNLLDTVVSQEENCEYEFYREIPKKRGLKKLRGQQRNAKECIEKLTKKHDCLRAEAEHTIIHMDKTGFRIDYQKSYSAKAIDGRKFAVLAVQQKSNMYASAHIETDIQFGPLNVQKALTHSLDETNKAGADVNGHSVRLIRHIRVEKVKATIATTITKPLPTVKEDDHSNKPSTSKFERS